MKVRALLTAPAVLRGVLTATAVGVAVVAGHGLLGLLAVLAYAWASSMISAGGGNTAKVRGLEDRLNAAMPRIPTPQNYDGPASNSSYPYGQYSYQSGNSSYPTGAGVSGSDSAWAGAVSGWTSNQGSGTTNPWPHAHTFDHNHTIYHSHNLGSLQSDINNLRNSYSDTVTAFNNHVGDYQNMVNALNTLRSDHSNLLNNHNALMFKLNASNLLQ